MKKEQSHNKLDISILFEGSWTPENISINEVKSTRLINKELEITLANSWEDTLRLANEQGKKVWESMIYRFENFKVSAKKLELSLSTIPFSTRLEMNKHTERIKKLGSSYGPKGIFTSCLVKTSDGYFVFIEKSTAYVTQKKYSWVGGVVSKSERELRSGEDLFSSTEQEILEELGLKKEHIVTTVLKIGYLTENWNTCFLFSINLSVAKDEVLRNFLKYSDDEANDLFFLNENQEIDMFDEKDKIKFVLLKISC